MEKRQLPDLLNEPASDLSLFSDCKVSLRAALLLLAALLLGLASGALLIAAGIPEVPGVILVVFGLGLLVVAGYLARRH